MRLVPVLTCSFSILVLACKCVDSRECSPERTTSTTIAVAPLAGVSRRITLEDSVSVSVEVDPQVATGYRSVSTSSGGAPKTIEQNEIRGRKLELSNREIRIGERSYGGFGENARIEIKPEGVFVDGVVRGKLEG